MLYMYLTNSRRNISNIRTLPPLKYNGIIKATRRDYSQLQLVHGREGVRQERTTKNFYVNHTVLVLPRSAIHPLQRFWRSVRCVYTRRGRLNVTFKQKLSHEYESALANVSARQRTRQQQHLFQVNHYDQKACVDARERATITFKEHHIFCNAKSVLTWWWEHKLCIPICIYIYMCVTLWAFRGLSHLYVAQP